ncbi:MAG TPA: hypothetical protein VEG84_09745 [Thermoanaerobaculia bacterium]|nr:hypothetical protein [Thermoanaerobaculia bacterium]
MIAFVTLFLGLMHGVRPVEVAVGAAASSIVFELDGKTVGRLGGPPWEADIDFGREFMPHELIVRAFDAKGQEIGLVRQWINLPRAPAEVDVVLERGPDGRAVAARWTWDSILGVRPNRVTVTFDGRPLAFEAKRVVLPSYDPDATHVLTAVLEYPNGVRSRRDVVLGGGSAGDAKSELTAVPVTIPNGSAPAPEALKERFQRGDQPLSVAAVEHGPAEVVLVRSLSSTEAQRILRRGVLSFSDKTKLAEEDRVRIVWPIAKRVISNGTSNELFDLSRDFKGKDTSFRFLLTQVDYPSASLPPPRMADAVAVAGLRACGSYGRRAVVLVLGSDQRDQSLYEAGPVRRYLDRLRVPLAVWSLIPNSASAASPWGEAEDISTLAGLERAVERLRQNLSRQSIVWLEGQYLPQDIRLASGDDGMELLR